jgi:hypothetical protein
VNVALAADTDDVHKAVIWSRETGNVILNLEGLKDGILDLVVTTNRNPH